MYYNTYESYYTWDEEYDSTWEDANPPEKKKPKRHQSNSWNRAARDMQNYRHGYRNKFTPPEDDLASMPNLEFYQNKIKFMPNGLKIEDLLECWKDDYNTLEYNHSFIQWLFPLQEHGVNPHAAPLSRKEIKIMNEDKDVTRRFLESYILMLGFYGIHLLDNETGKVARAENWEERFWNLDNHSHNNLRITRILKCLGELGYGKFQAPLVGFFLEETLCNGQLQNVKRSVLDYFMFTVKDKIARRKLVHFAWLNYKSQDTFIWGPVETLTNYKPDEESEKKANESEGNLVEKGYNGEKVICEPVAKLKDEDRKIKENETEGSQEEKGDQGKRDKNCDLSNDESQTETEPLNILQTSGATNNVNTDNKHLEENYEISEDDRKQDISDSKNEENDDAEEENEHRKKAEKSTGSEQVIAKGGSEMTLVTYSADKQYPPEIENKDVVMESGKQDISGSNNEENCEMKGENQHRVKEKGQTGGENGKEEAANSGTNIMTGSDSNLVKQWEDKEHEESENKNGIMESGKQDISGSKNEENCDMKGENQHREKEKGLTGGENGKEEAANFKTNIITWSDSNLVKQWEDKEHEESENKNGVMESGKQDISGSKNEENCDMKGENQHREKEKGLTGGENGKEEAANFKTNIITWSDSNLVKQWEDKEHEESENKNGAKETEDLENKKLLISNSETEPKICCAGCFDAIFSLCGYCCYICVLCNFNSY